MTFNLDLQSALHVDPHESESRRPSGLVSVIIVTWNAKADIDDCLVSLSRQTYSPLEVIVVDNESSDGTAAHVSRSWPDVVVVRGTHNTGYAGGNNLGARHAGGSVLFFVNPDTVVPPETVERLVGCLGRGYDICSPKLMLHGESNRINSSGNEMNFLGVAWAGGYANRDEGSDSATGLRETPYATGCAFAIPHTLFSELHGFDEDLFMYHEDVDIGLRARLLGSKIVCDRDAVVFHKYSFDKSRAKWSYMERNRLITLLKIYEARTLIAILPPLLLLECGVLVRAARQGWLRGKLLGYLNIARNLHSIGKKRRKVQSMRRIDDSELLVLLRGGVYSTEISGFVVDRLVNPWLERYLRILCRHLSTRGC